jgi:hypothetical protein
MFDRLRMKSGDHYVAWVARIAILSLWNYVETMLCFGIIYANHIGLLKHTDAAAPSLGGFDPFLFQRDHSIDYRLWRHRTARCNASGSCHAGAAWFHTRGLRDFAGSRIPA